MTTDGDQTPEESQPTKMQLFMHRMKEELGDNPELLRQALADLNAMQLQEVRNHFEGLLEYSRQTAEFRRTAHHGIIEYGSQTLKWSFFLNAGAIAIVMAYLGASAKGSATSVSALIPLLKSLWPFAAGCVSVVFSGGAAFFNFSYAEAATPSAETLFNFLKPGAGAWPAARFQKPDEKPDEFYRRFSYKVTWSRNIAVCLAMLSGLFFIYGVWGILHVALMLGGP